MSVVLCVWAEVEWKEWQGRPVFDMTGGLAMTAGERPIFANYLITKRNNLQRRRELFANERGGTGALSGAVRVRAARPP